MARKIKIALLVFSIVVIGGFGVRAARFLSSPTSKEINSRFITSNPLDLSQIRGFSKYRSCVGHDYRGPVMATGKMEDTPRSMKHYVTVRSDLRGKSGIVKALAPFDGKIFEVIDDFGGPGDQQIWLTPRSISSSSRSPRQWYFVFFHIALEDGLKEGSEVKAGQLIGTANLKRGPEGGTENFDIAVKFTRPFQRPALDAPFAHMAQNVLNEYARYGVTEANVLISKEKRDANLCPTRPRLLGGEGDEVYFSPPWSADDMIWLKAP